MRYSSSVSLYAPACRLGVPRGDPCPGCAFDDLSLEDAREAAAFIWRAWLGLGLGLGLGFALGLGFGLG